MTKVLASLFVLFVMLHAQSQISLSLGVTRISERLSPNNHFKFESKSDIFVDDYRYFKFQYKKKHVECLIDISNFSKENIRVSTLYIDNFGGGSSPIYKTRYYNSASVNYSYIGFKYGANYLFEGQSLILKKANATLGFGAFFQIDYLSKHVEDDLYSTITKSNNSNPTMTFVETSYLVNTNLVETTLPVNKFKMIGTQVSRKITYKHIFVDYNIAFGMFFRERIDILNTEAENHYIGRWDRIFLNTSVGAGYTF